LAVAHEIFHLGVTPSIVVAAVVSMTTNYLLNNELTYADKKLKGARFWIGLATFYAVCSLGLLANLSLANWVYRADGQFYLASIIGVVMSVVFNYSVTRVFTWR
ncbi:MAG: GtrA family protein, partial [Devosia sp.]